MAKLLELVSYLRSFGIEPNCSASTLLQTETRFGINHPIDYQNDQLYHYFFHSDFVPSIPQWWALDLHTFVRLKSYQILSFKECNWVSTWIFEISLDNITWKKVHSYDDFTYNETFKLPKIEVAQYIRITGNDEGCFRSGALAFSRIYLYGYPMYFQTCQRNAQISLKSFLPLIISFVS